MDGTLALIIITLLFIFLLAVGMHIGTVLMVAGVVGLILLDGFRSFPAVIQDSGFYSIATYSLTTIPLFILMAQFIVRSNIIGLLYRLIFNLSKERGGVLGAFTLMLGGFLGALSGSPTAISAALAEISLPELRKHGFNKYFAAATVAAAGSLSTIIPPSIILIVYGAATQTSIGQLFIAMTVPVVLTMVILFISIFILHRYTKEDVKDSSSNEVAATLDRSFQEGEMPPTVKNYTIAVGIMLVIISSIFLGIFFGIFTPTEAGAIGAMLSLIMAALLKKVNLEFFKASLEGTVKITTMVMFIILGASIFGKFMTLSLVPTKIISWIEPLLSYPILLMFLLLAIYFVLFMVIEGTAVILITVSVAVPIAAQAGYDPIVFGVLLTVVCAAGLLTPPVGLSVYSVAG
ncbi:TRAP transporter large permease [Halalkalibacter krulwichiae]|uniref:Sialic acid TRAP transporter permease protein SiaT n=2 Tax=Halalkalibacter krulwichiae TaxID=199441 RepID=A0A1X9MG47_9BACI|nr:TRAP transporter large permease subunit [Halalkalibacter krulwichiae]ARK32435.1 Sialic acid TRAP transporter permease protein SiaT [Halalkalibacter krulwichiae]